MNYVRRKTPDNDVDGSRWGGGISSYEKVNLPNNGTKVQPLYFPYAHIYYGDLNMSNMNGVISSGGYSKMLYLVAHNYEDMDSQLLFYNFRYQSSSGAITLNQLGHTGETTYSGGSVDYASLVYATEAYVDLINLTGRLLLSDGSQMDAVITGEYAIVLVFGSTIIESAPTGRNLFPDIRVTMMREEPILPFG